jgi:hypothetical protein
MKDTLERIEAYYGQRDSYNTQKREQLANVYELLSSLEAEPNKDAMSLWIWVYKKDSWGRIHDYRESAYSSREIAEQRFKVLAVDMHYDNDIRYSYSGQADKGSDTYRSYLGFYIEDETLEGFSKEGLLAHLLWDFCAC